MQAQAHIISGLSWGAFKTKAPAKKQQLTGFLETFDLSLLPHKECNNKQYGSPFCQTTTIDYAELEESCRRGDIKFISHQGYTGECGRLVLQPELVSHDRFINELLGASVTSPTETNGRADLDPWVGAIESDGSIRVKKIETTQEGKQRITTQGRSEYAACIISDSQPDLTSGGEATKRFACFPIHLSRGGRGSIDSRVTADLQLGETYKIGSERHPFAICRSFVQGVDHPNLDPIYWFTQLYNDYQRHPDLLCIGFTVSWSLAAKMNELSCDYGHWEHYIGSLSERLHQKDNASEKLKCIRQEIVRKLGLDHEKSPQFKVECWRMFRGGCIKLVDYTVDVDDKFLSSNDPFNNDEYKGKAETFFLSTGLRFPIGAVSTDRIKHIIEKEFYGRTISRVIARHPRNEAEYSITKVASKIYHKDETDSKVHRYFFGRDGHRHELPVLESTRAAIGRNTPGKTDYLCSKFDSGSFARFKPFDDVIEILDENHLVVDQCSCYKVSSSWLENIPHYRWRRSYPIEVWRKTLSEYVSRHCLARFILPQMHSLARKKVKACFERMIYGAIGEERPQLRSEISCDRMNLLEAKARDLMKTSGLRRKKTHQWTLSSFAAQDLTPAAAGRIITDLLKQTSECLTELECNSCDLRFSREAPAGFFLYPFLAMYEISSVLSAIVDAFREVFEDVADSTGWPYYEWDDSVKHSRTPYAGRSIPVRAGKKFPLHKESSPNGPDRLFDLDSDYLHRLCTVFKWIRGQLILMCRGFYEFTSCVQVFSQYGCSDNVERYLAEVLVQRLTMPLSFRNLPKFTANLLVYGSCSTFFQLTSTDTKRGRWSSMNFDVYKLIRDHVIGADYSEDESNLESVWFQTFQGERYE